MTPGRSTANSRSRLDGRVLDICPVSVGPDTYQITVETGTTVTAPLTASRDIRRHKASNYG